MDFEEKLIHLFRFTKNKYSHLSMKSRFLSFLLLIFFIVLTIEILVWKDFPMLRVGHMKFNFGGTQIGSGNWIPFKTIVPYILGEKGWLIGGINILGNILILVPIGFLFPFAFQPCSWKKCGILALLFCSSIEGLQVFYQAGIFDVDDVILNVLGVFSGFWLGQLFQNSQFFQSILTPKKLGIFFITGILFLGLFLRYGPIGLEKAPVRELRTSSAAQTGIKQLQEDLCNGTGGTGQITSKGLHYFMLKSHEGRTQKILLTPSTTIRTSAGPAKESDLQVGNRVTIIVDESETAQLVLVCL
jgi:glycopeptide antibiotics resistance protein